MSGSTVQPYIPLGAAKELFHCQAPEVLMDGPADTGKSRACLEKLYLICSLVSNVRFAMVRKTRRSLTQTGMITFENKVLPPGSAVKFHTTLQAYIFPNKSQIAVWGLDDPLKVQSGEYDGIYVQEATELIENDWEMISKLLRNGVLPYQQLLADCNPGPPTHWLNQRCIKKLTTRLQCRHTDNPSITKERLERLQRLSGVRRKRLFEGRWVAADGQVYDNWNPDIHFIKRFPIPAGWRKIGAVDWGFTNAGCIQIWAIDGDGRAYLIHEVYRVQKKVNPWWIAAAKRLMELYENVDTFFCDPSEPQYIKDFQDAGIPAKPADNAVLPGIQEIHGRLDIAEDGRPRLFVFQDALEELDPVLLDEHRPMGFVQEIDSYIKKKTPAGFAEEPAEDQDDHGLDTGRYALKSIASRGSRLLPSKVVTTAIGYKRPRI